MHWDFITAATLLSGVLLVGFGFLAPSSEVSERERLQITLGGLAAGAYAVVGANMESGTFVYSPVIVAIPFAAVGYAGWRLWSSMAVEHPAPTDRRDEPPAVDRPPASTDDGPAHHCLNEACDAYGLPTPLETCDVCHVPCAMRRGPHAVRLPEVTVAARPSPLPDWTQTTVAGSSDRGGAGPAADARDRWTAPTSGPAYQCVNRRCEAVGLGTPLSRCDLCEQDTGWRRGPQAVPAPEPAR